MKERKTVKERVGMGAAQFFITNSALDTNKESIQETIKDDMKSNAADNEQCIAQDTTQCTTKYTIETPEKTELYNDRLVANVTKRQKKYIKEMAKKFENESDFVRFMINYFMNNVNIK